MNDTCRRSVLALLCVSSCAAAYAREGGRSADTAAARAAVPRAPEKPRVDWADLGRYEDANARLASAAADERRVVFMGDSITDFWIEASPDFFAKNPYVDRGISGQTAPQMLLRFRPDVIALKPKAVLILAGTNDVAGNTGYESTETILGYLTSMVELSRANGIVPVLCSVLPAADFPWNRGLEPAPRIVELNARMKEYARMNRVVYADYHRAMADERMGLKAELSDDGVHPNKAGYAVMEPIARQAIAEALSGK